MSINAALVEVGPDPSVVDWDALEWEAAAQELGKRRPLPQAFLVTVQHIPKCPAMANVSKEWRHLAIS